MRSVEVLHGKLSSKEKNEIMESFRDGLIDVLVSTTVVEVGVDVPSASVRLLRMLTALASLSFISCEDVLVVAKAW